MVEQQTLPGSTAARQPPRVRDQHHGSSAYARANKRIAITITRAVGSMTCAYIFAGIALIGLPGAISQGVLGIVQWVAQTFIQLVLLSVIMVGQNVQARAADARAEATFADTEVLRTQGDAVQADVSRLLAEVGELARAAGIPVDGAHRQKTRRTKPTSAE